MDLSRLEILKEKCAKAKDLSTVFYYFLDHFGENTAFLDLGERTRNFPLEAFILAVGKELLGKNCVVRDPLLIAVPNTNFIHGSFKLNRNPGSVIYFSDIQTGVVTMLPIRPGEITHFSRFSAQSIPREASVSEN